MAVQLREAARELELEGDYSEVALVRVKGVYQQLCSAPELARCGACACVIYLNGLPRPPNCPHCGTSWTEKRKG